MTAPSASTTDVRMVEGPSRKTGSGMHPKPQSQPVSQLGKRRFGCTTLHAPISRADVMTSRHQCRVV